MNKVIGNCSILLLVTVMAGLLACDKDMNISVDTGQSAHKLVITGSDTMIELNEELARAFMANNPDKKIECRGGGSGHGIEELIAGNAGLAAASREFRSQENRRFRERRVLSPSATQIGRDAVALYIHPSNKIPALTLNDIAKVFTGKITNWAELGGADLAIVVCNRTRSSGTRSFFNRYAMNSRAFVEAAVEFEKGTKLIGHVAENPGAIGFGPFINNPTIQILGIIDFAGKASYPTESDALARRYPLMRALNLIAVGPATGLSQEFLEFCLGKEGQKIVSTRGFIATTKKSN